MGLSLLIAIVLLIAIFCGIFAYRPHSTYQVGDSIVVIVAAIAALLLFLMSINVIHI